MTEWKSTNPTSSSSQSSIAAMKNFLADRRLTPLSTPLPSPIHPLTHPPTTPIPNVHCLAVCLYCSVHTLFGVLPILCCQYIVWLFAFTVLSVHCLAVCLYGSVSFIAWLFAYIMLCQFHCLAICLLYIVVGGCARAIPVQPTLLPW